MTALDQAELSQGALTVVALAFFCGGFVKGAIGFALPTVALALSASVLPPQVAVACLAVPTLVSNVWQSARSGLADGLATTRRFRVLIVVLLISLLIATQLVPWLSERVMIGILGGGVVAFAAAQLLGWKPPSPPRPSSDIVTGVIAGAFGGLLGIWGPPVMLFLVALGLSTAETIRAAGITFLLGSIPFIAGHLWSGLLSPGLLVVSAGLCVPMAVGMWLGQKVQDRLNAAALRRFILLGLLLAGLNFLRRALL